jgi:hypothetical protein
MKHVMIRENAVAEHQFWTPERDRLPSARSATAAPMTWTTLPILHWITISIGGLVTLAWLGLWSWVIASLLR